MQLCETWILTCKSKKLLRMFQSTILRKIFILIKNRDGTWRIQMNYELNYLIKSADIGRVDELVWTGDENEE